MARKTKYKPEAVERIRHAIKLGATHELAAAYGGIGVATFYQWMKDKPDFAQVVELAEGEAAVGWLSKIEAAAMDGNWQAAAWKLERRYPGDYGRRTEKPKEEEAQSGGLRIIVGDPSPDQARRMAFEALSPEDRSNRIDELLAKRKSHEEWLKELD